MRRSSAGYVKSLNEDEDDEFSSPARSRTSWKKRLLRKSNKSKASVPSASEKPLLEQVMSSDDNDGIHPALSSQSETSSRVSDAAPPPEHRPQHRDPPAPETTPVTTRQEQSPFDPVVQGVKKKLDKEKTTTPSSSSSKRTTPVAALADPAKLSPTALPKTPPREKKVSDEMTKVRAALSRPFGRNSLPPHMASNWVVEVSPAEWDADEERWKYRILVQRRTLAQLDESMTTAFTWRSLADFVWLEQALRAEYHGALLLPLLSIAVGTPDVVNFTQQDVDSVLLKDWLNDVLNGIRGQGMLL